MGGVAVHVGTAETRARWRLKSVGAVHEWLAALLLAQDLPRSAAH
jgi:hypothetical protein